MKPLTWRQVLDALKELSDDQLDMTATILNLDIMEVFSVWETTLVSECPDKIRQELDGVISLEQPIMTMGGE